MISRYMIVQIIVYSCEFLIFTIGIHFVITNLGILLWNFLAKLISLLMAFFMHRAWTFRHNKSGSLFVEIGKYLALFVLHLIASLLLTWLFLYFGMKAEIAKVLSDTICVAGTFYAVKTYIFQKKKIIN